MKRANHNTEGKFCQNLGEPTHAVSHCQAIFLSFLADFPISSTGPRIHSEYGCHGARDLTFTFLDFEIGNDRPQYNPELHPRLPCVPVEMLAAARAAGGAEDDCTQCCVHA